jgi:tetratricopeptide (TPR) repeat protein
MQHVQARFQAQQFAEAVQLMHHELEQQPTNAGAWCALAVALNRLQRYSEAVQAAEQAITLDPAPSLAYQAKSLALWGLGCYSAAWEAYEQARQRDPTVIPAYWQLLCMEAGPRVLQRGGCQPEHGGPGWARTALGKLTFRRK